MHFLYLLVVEFAVHGDFFDRRAFIEAAVCKHTESDEEPLLKEFVQVLAAKLLHDLPLDIDDAAVVHTDRIFSQCQVDRELLRELHLHGILLVGVLNLFDAL